LFVDLVFQRIDGSVSGSDPQGKVLVPGVQRFGCVQKCCLDQTAHAHHQRLD
jgi:hypothetical protein